MICLDFDFWFTIWANERRKYLRGCSSVILAVFTFIAMFQLSTRWTQTLLYFLIVTALLRCNLKCKFQWLLVSSLLYICHNQFCIQITPKDTPYLLAILSHFLPISQPSSPGQPSVYFCLYRFAFRTFCTNGIIQYVVFCDWLLSWSIMFARFIHVVAFISTLFLSLNNIPLCGYSTSYLSVHQLMEVWVVSTLWLLWIMQPWTFVYKVLCGHLFSFLLGIDRPRSRIAGSNTNCV